MRYDLEPQCPWPLRHRSLTRQGDHACIALVPRSYRTDEFENPRLFLGDVQPFGESDISGSLDWRPVNKLATALQRDPEQRLDDRTTRFRIASELKKLVDEAVTEYHFTCRSDFG